MLNKNNYLFPEFLTERDKDLVLIQCENQHATTHEAIEGFAKAYARAKQAVQMGESFMGSGLQDLILELATLIDSRNEKGYRTTGVAFPNCSEGLAPGLVPRAMEGFAFEFIEGVKTPEELYKEFQEIHPFEDGNGRVGDLLWKMATCRETRIWPEVLPPKMFD